MKTILITGANRGIGFGLVNQYLKSNWQVLACCRKPDLADGLQELKTQYPESLTILKLDISDENSIQTLGTQLQNKSIDVLINNAGVLLDSGNPKLNQQILLETFNVNVVGPLLLSRAIISSLQNGSEKKIINVSSFLGSIANNTDGNYSAYRASKTALNALSKNLAVEWREQGLIVIALDPGWVKTDMGGNQAPLSIEESVKGIQNVISDLTMKESGSFIRYDGQHLAW